MREVAAGQRRQVRGGGRAVVFLASHPHHQPEGLRDRFLSVALLQRLLQVVPSGFRVFHGKRLRARAFPSRVIAGSEGIGYYIMTMQYAMRPGDMYAAIFLLAALGYGLNLILLAVEQRLLHWWQRAGK